MSNFYPINHDFKIKLTTYVDQVRKNDHQEYDSYIQ